jgi:hypothetical protein
LGKGQIAPVFVADGVAHKLVSKGRAAGRGEWKIKPSSLFHRGSASRKKRLSVA